MKTSKLEQLTPEDQQRVIDLCKDHTYNKVAEILAKPRPEGLALNTSTSALCRFNTTWDPLHKQARLMEQLGRSLRVRRQATPVAALTGVLAIIENNVLNQLSRGKPTAEMAPDINLLCRVHRAFISEESLNHKRGDFNSRATYFEDIKEQADHIGESDCAPNDQPDENGYVEQFDNFTREDLDVEDVYHFLTQQGGGVHFPLNAQNYRAFIVERIPMPRPARNPAAVPVDRNPATANSSPASEPSATPDNTVHFPNPMTQILDSLTGNTAGNSAKIPSNPPAIPQIPRFFDNGNSGKNPLFQEPKTHPYPQKGGPMKP